MTSHHIKHYLAFDNLRFLFKNTFYHPGECFWSVNFHVYEWINFLKKKNFFLLKNVIVSIEPIPLPIACFNFVSVRYQLKKE